MAVYLSLSLTFIVGDSIKFGILVPSSVVSDLDGVGFALSDGFVVLPV